MLRPVLVAACVGWAVIVSPSQFIHKRSAGGDSSTACADAETAGTARYVLASATGSNNGTNWTNAWTSMSTAESNVTRGQTLCVGDGTYGSVTFNVALSGTTTITVKKATVADHGTSTGWLDAHGDGQATFTGWGVDTGYWVFDGASRSAGTGANWDGAIATYGFRVTGGGVNGRAIELAAASNSTFRYIDAVGGGEGTGDGDDVIYGLNGPSNVIFEYMSMRDSDRTIFLQRGCWQNMIVRYSFMGRNNSTPSIHGELLSDTCSDGNVFANNWVTDIEGTAVWAVLNGTGGKTASNTADGWKIYGNIITQTQGDAYSGVVYCANDGSNSNWCDNLEYYNNTHINGSIAFYLIFVEAGSGNVTTNNVYYSAGGTSTGYSTGLTFSNNWYFSTANSADTGTGKTVCTVSCSAFFVSASTNMHLAQALAGVSLAAEFNTDIDGVTRGADGTWDRGAFEYVSGGPPPPPDLLVLLMRPFVRGWHAGSRRMGI